MKKHFLFLSLLAFVCLGLGNYTNAAVTCADGTTKCDTLAQCDCVQPDLPDNTDWLCNPCKSTSTTPTENLKSDCEILGGVWMTADGSQGCCDTACQTCKTKAGSVLKYDNFTKSIQCYTTGDQAFGNSISGAPCDDPKGGEMKGTFGSLDCSCPEGTKEINRVCKPCSDRGVCCGIQLNTSVPFIGNCIEDGSSAPGPGETSVTGESAFPTLMGSLTKILVTVILIVSFVLIIVGGIMIATGNPSGGKKMIMKVVVGIALLGASGVILRLINPNFFG